MDRTSNDHDAGNLRRLHLALSYLNIGQWPGIVACLREVGGPTALPGAIGRGDTLSLDGMIIREALDRVMGSEDFDVQCEHLAELGGDTVALGEPEYPALLAEIHDPPLVLFLRGNRQLLASPQLAMVGSRKASRGGLDHAYRFAQALAANGMGVLSGLALGIDGASHRGALAVQGQTTAVLGAGIDVVYPPQHRDLYTQMVDHGLLISEYRPGTPPRRHQFPKRNRIISGMSLGVMVIEAAVNSGSLITARSALEQGREVFAIPGSIHNPSAKGCHRLLREGATLVETVDDILAELGGWIPREPTLSSNIGIAALGRSERKLLEEMGHEPVTMDQMHNWGLGSAAELAALLTVLELEGYVEQLAGRYRRIR